MREAVRLGKASRSENREGQHVDQRLRAGLRTKQKPDHDERRRQAGGRGEHGEEERHRQTGEDENRDDAAVPIRPPAEQRDHEHLQDARKGERQPDLGDAKPARVQPEGKEGRLDAEDEEDRAVDERQPRFDAAPVRRRSGQSITAALRMHTIVA